MAAAVRVCNAFRRGASHRLAGVVHRSVEPAFAFGACRYAPSAVGVESTTRYIHGSMQRREVATAPTISDPFLVVADSDIPHFDDGRVGSWRDLVESVAGERPMLLFCGAAWSSRSKVVADRLREWAREEDREIVLATTDMQHSPKLVQEKHIQSIPAVLLFRGGKIERRADGADLTQLERILDTVAELQPSKAMSSTAEMSPGAAVKAADELKRRGIDSSKVTAVYQRALDAGPSPHAFRARLGLLECALDAAKSAPTAEIIDEITRLLGEVHGLHGDELKGEIEGADIVTRLLAHAGLLVDAWDSRATASSSMEAKILQEYVNCNYERALHLALESYKRAVLTDTQGLVLAYGHPERPVPDTKREAHAESSVWHTDDLAQEIAAAPGPVPERSLLRRLFAATAGPAIGHDDKMYKMIQKARVDLAFLLDTEEWVPFHTRRIFLRGGGKPKMGRGTGSGSGYSKGYWLTSWGPDRLRRNQRPMGSPWSDKGD